MSGMHVLCLPGLPQAPPDPGEWHCHLHRLVCSTAACGGQGTACEWRMGGAQAWTSQPTLKLRRVAALTQSGPRFERAG